MSNQNKTWTVVDLIRATTEFFTAKKIENPRLNAELLLAKILNFPRVDLYVNYDRPLKDEELSAYRTFVKRRVQYEPLQYILGETEFMGLSFKVNPAVLIPRPETEFLVDHIIENTETKKISQPCILEIGTGSGCIAISLAHHIDGGCVYATDVSAEAIEVARENAEINLLKSEDSTESKNHNINFFQHDIFKDWLIDLPTKIDILVSNPPYINEKELADLADEVIGYEPKIALTDGADGLSFYKRIFDLAKNDLQVNWVFLEMSGSQSDKIIKTAEQFGFQNIKTRKDLAGIDRIIEIRV